MLEKFTPLMPASVTVLMFVLVVNGPWNVTLENDTCSASSTIKMLCELAESLPYVAVWNRMPETSILCGAYCAPPVPMSLPTCCKLSAVRTTYSGSPAGCGSQ